MLSEALVRRTARRKTRPRPHARSSRASRTIECATVYSSGPAECDLGSGLLWIKV